VYQRQGMTGLGVVDIEGGGGGAEALTRPFFRHWRLRSTLLQSSPECLKYHSLLVIVASVMLEEALTTTKTYWLQSSEGVAFRSVCELKPSCFTWHPDLPKSAYRVHTTGGYRILNLITVSHLTSASTCKYDLVLS